MTSPATASSLPSGRKLLTSLLDAISTLPVPKADDKNQASSTTGQQDATKLKPRTTPFNPLKQLTDPAHRSLFTTLHVLFPALLLPALDLLDQHLVTHLTVATDPGTSISSPKQHDDAGDDRVVTTAPAALSKTYQVHSAQTSVSFRARRFGDIPPYYIVHTAAWNCTCAAFTYAAFLPPTQALPMEALHRPMQADEQQFGGLSDDGVREETTPPCCKHLLACVLAERWEAGLGGIVQRREVAREEMAGILAGV